MDAIFVSAEFVRSYQTAALLEAAIGAPVKTYLARSPDSEDILKQVSEMDPCPENVMIVTHGL